MCPGIALHSGTGGSGNLLRRAQESDIVSEYVQDPVIGLRHESGDGWLQADPRLDWRGELERVTALSEQPHPPLLPIILLFPPPTSGQHTADHM